MEVSPSTPTPPSDASLTLSPDEAVVQCIRLPLALVSRHGAMSAALWFGAMVRWQLDTFPDATTYSCYAHLCDEVLEAGDAEAAFRFAEDADRDEARKDLAGELADVFLLTLAVATRAEISLEQAIAEKFEANLNRTFTYDPERGYAKGSDECQK